MSLEFNKLTAQVQKMGDMVEQLDFDISEQLIIAKRRFAAAGDIDAVSERIQWVRQSNISGYRGAALLDDMAMPPNMIFPAPPPTPEHTTIIAADGSQIYPNERAPVHYYLINIGVYIYRTSDASLPEQLTIPSLYYHKAHVHDEHQRVITNRTVDARRTVAEMQALQEIAWERYRQHKEPIVALYDNNLMFAPNKEIMDQDTLMNAYHGALSRLHDFENEGAKFALGGYVDNPRGSVVLRLLHLLTIRDAQELKFKQKEIESGGDLDGLRDQHLFRAVLKPGERSATLVQNSPRNFAFKQRNPAHEIAFFYVKVGNERHSNIARVDVPAWVAKNPQLVDYLHAVLLDQAAMQGRNPYPYALTRADELAYVSSKDKAKLEEMINIELRLKGIGPLAIAPKARGKELARSDRTAYEVDTHLH